MNKQEKKMIALVGVILAVLVAATVAVFVMKQNDNGFVPPAFDSTAVSGYPTVTDQYAQYQNIRVNEDFAFSMCLCPMYSDGKAEIYFAAAGDNNVYTLVKLYDQDGDLIGESGLVKPGEYVQSIGVSIVPTEYTDITARVLSYEPETYYSKGTASGKLSLRTAD